MFWFLAVKIFKVTLWLLFLFFFKLPLFSFFKRVIYLPVYCIKVPLLFINWVSYLFIWLLLSVFEASKAIIKANC
jgi:hypothetical protein